MCQRRLHKVCVLELACVSLHRQKTTGRQWRRSEVKGWRNEVRQEFIGNDSRQNKSKVTPSIWALSRWHCLLRPRENRMSHMCVCVCMGLEKLEAGWDTGLLCAAPLSTQRNNVNITIQKHVTNHFNAAGRCYWALIAGTNRKALKTLEVKTHVLAGCVSV